MRPVENRKKIIIQATRDIYGPDIKGFWLDVKQVDKKTLYKKSSHGRVKSEKDTKLVGVFYSRNKMTIRKGVSFKNFIDTLAHEMGHYVVRRYGVTFPNTQTEEAFATYFSCLTFEKDMRVALGKAQKIHRKPDIIKCYGFKKYRTHWKLAKEFASIITGTNKYKRFRKMLMEKSKDIIS